MKTQVLRIRSAPTMRDLMSDEIYAAYMSKRFKLPPAAYHGNPWRILAQRVTDDDKTIWAVRDEPTYVNAHHRLTKLLEQSKWTEVVLISRIKFFAPPRGFEWDPKLDWCGRCRRPTMFKVMWKRHPALRDAPVVQYGEDLHRCMFCGVRQGFGPTFEMRF